MEKTSVLYLACRLEAVMDSDVVEGKVVLRKRFTARILDKGMNVGLVADSLPEALHKLAMYVEAEGITL